MAEDKIPLRSHEEEKLVFGSLDRNAKRIRELYDVNLISREGLLKLVGQKAAVREVKQILEKILTRVRRGENLDSREVERWLVAGSKQSEFENGDEDSVDARVPVRRYRIAGQKVSARNPGQERYLKAMRENAICFGIGPAGTGKTYLAVTMAVEALRKGEYRKLILARPAVEAGERLGFLPGDLQEKVNPYLRPLYDALDDQLEPGQAAKYIENGVIEIVPLAYMRGRTLNHSFIILDEGQNTTPKQMQMFLTRMGEESKVVITGDVTQTDLPPSTRSGLVDAWERLNKVKGIAFVEFAKSDIVRHPLVQRIVEAYEK